MSTHSNSARQYRVSRVELRTGRPYANLIRDNYLYSDAVADYFGVSPEDVIPTMGATGAIELTRIHVFKQSRTKNPTVLTVSPGYWRARESFQGLGFKVSEIRTQAAGFTIDEAAVVERAKAEVPELLYLSLPNNPTGATFDPDLIARELPAETAFVLDMTLPAADLDTRALLGKMYRGHRGRRNLFLIGSTSKTHGTAELRAGWTVCANSEDAAELSAEHRNSVPCVSIGESIRQLGQAPTVTEKVRESHRLLEAAEGLNLLGVVRPRSRTKSAYVLVELRVDVELLRRKLAEDDIGVVWGGYLGLSDRYVRLEMSEPAALEEFVNALHACAGGALSDRPLIESLA